MPSSLDLHLNFCHVFGEGTKKGVEDKVEVGFDIVIHSGKVSRLFYTDSVEELLDANLSLSKPCLNMI